MLKWWSITIVLIPFIFILSVLVIFDDLQTYLTVSDVSDRLTNSGDLVSWMFGGIMSLLGFITLFVAFSYENKLIVASRINERILRPYASSLEEIIMSQMSINYILLRIFSSILFTGYFLLFQAFR